MDAVENSNDNGPMKIGFGKKPQIAALHVAGAEKVFSHPEQTDLIVDLAGASVREGDTLIVVSPSLLSVSQIRHLRDACSGDLRFQVVGHEPELLLDDQQIRTFRKKYPKGVETEVPQVTGRPKSIKYTLEQADAIIRLWHDVPKRKPADIAKLADKILNLPDGTIKVHWVRDLVIKYVRTAKREKPEGWRGVRID